MEEILLTVEAHTVAEITAWVAEPGTETKLIDADGNPKTTVDSEIDARLATLASKLATAWQAIEQVTLRGPPDEVYWAKLKWGKHVPGMKIATKLHFCVKPLNQAWTPTKDD
jgi:hypothetical protein